MRVCKQCLMACKGVGPKCQMETTPKIRSHRRLQAQVFRRAVLVKYIPMASATNPHKTGCAGLPVSAVP